MSSNLTAAYEAVSNYDNLDPIWISGDAVVSKFMDSTPKHCCYIFSTFSGPVFEHFKALGSAVFGPQVLLAYLREQKPLPHVDHPLYSTALRNCNVTVTSITGQMREDLYRAVETLHGIASRNLTDDVNVIISPKVGSRKYIVGASRGVHIVKPEWIDEAWRLSETSDTINMLQESVIAQYKLSIFAQLVVCVSGLTATERKEVSDIVTANGGTYSGEMKIGITTHLVVKKAGGVKYNFAKKWKVRVVAFGWVMDSVKAGYALDENAYVVAEEPGQRNYSTPATSMCVGDPSVLNEISAICETNQGRIDETEISCFRDVTNNNTAYLSGCVICLYSCTASETAKYEEIIRLAGGKCCSAFYDKVTQAVTHVVVGAEAKSIPSSEIDPNAIYVTHSWLEQCRDHGRRLLEDDFKPDVLDETTVSAEHQAAESSKPPEVQVDTTEIRLINQYFEDEDPADIDDFLTEDDKTESALPEPQKGGEEEERENQEPSEKPLDPKADDETVLGGGIFSMLVFKPHSTFSFTANTPLTTAITENGGTVVNDTASRADYIVCPYVIRQAVSNSMVTPYWIQSCVASNSHLVSELDSVVGFRPVHIPPSSPLPLKGCVLSLSGFVGNDRVFFTDLASCLGAEVQECFLRKSIPARNLKRSTHLVATRPDGRKYPAAKQWGLPAVSCSWLYACARSGLRPAESDHPVSDEDPSVPPEDWSCRTPVAESGEQKSMAPSTSRISLGEQVLKTPAWVRSNARPSDPPVLTPVIHVSPPMSDQVSKCLERALAITSRPRKGNPAENDLGAEFAEAAAQREGSSSDGILHGVVICVAKGLSSRQVVLNEIVKKLGGDFRWSFDPTVCTHMVACPRTCIQSAASPMVNPQGQLTVKTAVQSPLAPDVQSALAEAPRVHVVLPDWLTQCQRRGKRLPETDFLAFPAAGPDRSFTALPDTEPSTDYAQDPAPAESKSNGGGTTEIAPTKSADASLTDDDAVLAAQLDLIEGGLPSTSATATSATGTRRSHRTRRRGTPGSIEGTSSGVGLGLIEGDVNFGGVGNPSSTASTSSSNHHRLNKLDMPGSSLQVRWQYDDSPGVRHVQSSPLLVRNESSNDSNSPPVQPQPPAQPPQQAPRNQSPEKLTPKTQPKPAVVAAPKPRVFSLSGLEQDEKVRYQAIIAELGGGVDTGLTVGEKTTHLIIGAPSRCEKYLMSLAGGLWVLHKSYVEASGTAGAWLSEEGYEWGGPGTEPLLTSAISPRPPSGGLSLGQLKDLARAARHWRRAGGGAFNGWRVVFGPGCDRESSFRRIIEFGGGKVLANSPPYPPASQVTHAFMKRRHGGSSSSGAEDPVQAAAAAATGYQWLRIEFLCAHLTGAGSTPRTSFLVGATPADKRPSVAGVSVPPPAVKRSKNGH